MSIYLSITCLFWESVVIVSTIISRVVCLCVCWNVDVYYVCSTDSSVMLLLKILCLTKFATRVWIVVGFRFLRRQFVVELFIAMKSGLYPLLSAIQYMMCICITVKLWLLKNSLKISRNQRCLTCETELVLWFC